MILRALAGILALAAATALAQPHSTGQSDNARATQAPAHRRLSLANKPFMGDF